MNKTKFEPKLGATVGGAAVLISYIYITVLFAGPFVTTIKSILKISNENEQSVGFAIKTTAPRIFMVSPNSSVIQPRQAITVESMSQMLCIDALFPF